MNVMDVTPKSTPPSTRGYSATGSKFFYALLQVAE